MLPVKKSPNAIASKPASLKEVKTEAVNKIEVETSLPVPERVQGVLFKAIAKTHAGNMRAEELSAITAGCKFLVELEATNTTGKKK